jgi:hypothetical protein
MASAAGAQFCRQGSRCETAFHRTRCEVATVRAVRRCVAKGACQLVLNIWALANFWLARAALGESKRAVR